MENLCEGLQSNETYEYDTFQVQDTQNPQQHIEKPLFLQSNSSHFQNISSQASEQRTTQCTSNEANIQDTNEVYVSNQHQNEHELEQDNNNAEEFKMYQYQCLQALDELKNWLFEPPIEQKFNEYLQKLGRIIENLIQRKQEKNIVFELAIMSSNIKFFFQYTIKNLNGSQKYANNCKKPCLCGKFYQSKGDSLKDHFSKKHSGVANIHHKYLKVYRNLNDFTVCKSSIDNYFDTLKECFKAFYISDLFKQCIYNYKKEGLELVDFLSSVVDCQDNQYPKLTETFNYLNKQLQEICKTKSDLQKFSHINHESFNDNQQYQQNSNQSFNNGADMEQSNQAYYNQHNPHNNQTYSNNYPQYQQNFNPHFQNQTYMNQEAFQQQINSSRNSSLTTHHNKPANINGNQQYQQNSNQYFNNSADMEKSNQSYYNQQNPHNNQTYSNNYPQQQQNCNPPFQNQTYMKQEAFYQLRNSSKNLSLATHHNNPAKFNGNQQYQQNSNQYFNNSADMEKSNQYYYNQQNPHNHMYSNNYPQQQQNFNPPFQNQTQMNQEAFQQQINSSRNLFLANHHNNQENSNDNQQCQQNYTPFFNNGADMDYKQQGNSRNQSDDIDSFFNRQ